ncbi:HAD family hydrolase [Kribbella antibiotica]|uniref:HAD family hydrolase n=1 Tax=Kribbella antibiotica TaxID=190195 RepID=A0A4R5A048_9ACTN|nr:HAD family hydrolase [Kribbella antibiotica]TDD62842.1 HAD family hydrolase [Kribbella antibiotica]
MGLPRLICFDLDNTLIDRDSAFRDWARWWSTEAGLGEAAVDWLVAHDNKGFAPRPELFAGLRHNFGVAPTVDSYDREHPLFTRVDSAVLDGLAQLRAAGWRTAVVTNGTVLQQTLKLEHTGIATAVDFWCISEAVGIRKPDARIFALAAEGAGAALDGWMVGDQPAHDVQGGHNAGLHTILIGSASGPPAPDHQFASIHDALTLLRTVPDHPTTHPCAEK